MGWMARSGYFLITALLVGGCVAHQVEAAPTRETLPAGATNPLDQTATTIADEIARELPRGIAIAVLPLTDPDRRVRQLGEVLSDMVALRLSRSGVQVVERSRLGETWFELQLSSSALVEDASARSFGRTVGAAAVSIGSVWPQGKDAYRVNLRVVESETGEVLAGSEALLVWSSNDLWREVPGFYADETTRLKRAIVDDYARGRRASRAGDWWGAMDKWTAGRELMERVKFEVVEAKPFASELDGFVTVAQFDNGIRELLDSLRLESVCRVSPTSEARRYFRVTTSVGDGAVPVARIPVRFQFDDVSVVVNSGPGGWVEAPRVPRAAELALAESNVLGALASLTRQRAAETYPAQIQEVAFDNPTLTTAVVVPDVTEATYAPLIRGLVAELLAPTLELEVRLTEDAKDQLNVQVFVRASAGGRRGETRLNVRILAALGRHTIELTKELLARDEKLPQGFEQQVAGWIKTEMLAKLLLPWKEQRSRRLPVTFVGVSATRARELVDKPGTRARVVDERGGRWEVTSSSSTWLTALARDYAVCTADDGSIRVVARGVESVGPER